MGGLVVSTICVFCSPPPRQLGNLTCRCPLGGRTAEWGNVTFISQDMDGTSFNHSQPRQCTLGMTSSMSTQLLLDKV